MKKTVYVLTVLVAASSICPAFAAKESLKDKLARASKVYFIPLEPKPFEAVLEVTRRDKNPDGSFSSVMPSEKFRLAHELAPAKEFEALNKKILEFLKKELHAGTSIIPESFAMEKKLFGGGKAKVYDLKNLDCDLYVEAAFEKPGQAREALYSMGSFDWDQEAAYISVSLALPNLSLTLYENRQGKKGDKILSERVSLAGKHWAESIPGVKYADVIKDRIESRLANPPKKPKHGTLDTDYFPWHKGLYADNRELLEKGFRVHSEDLKIKVRERMAALIPQFQKILHKKLK